MKVSKASYLDDAVSVSGVLIERFLRRPVFYAFDESCGWKSQVITKAQKDKVVLLVGEPHTGKVCCDDGKEKEN